LRPKYKPHLDGLRTMAIVPVVLFHAGVQGVGRGFVGVDIFFVISGYLITKIIVDEIDAGAFTLLNFYERRIRRIIPALLALSIAVVIASALILFPGEYKSVPPSIFSSLLFYSNILFYSRTDYFGGGAHDNPMLHTWSLAVEEQFYILFPLLLILIRRCCPRFRAAIILVLFLTSLTLSAIVVRHDAALAFYMIPTRAWELLAGSLLALQLIPETGRREAREVAAAVGLILLVLSFGLYTDKTPLGGEAMLPPVIGSMLIIEYGDATLVGRLLSLKPIVFIGLVSYSLYLWHWPVIVFIEYMLDKDLHGLWTVAAIALSFALAVLSWRFIERPFRSRDSVPRKLLFRRTAIGSALVLLAAGVAEASHGWPGRFSREALHYASFAEASSPLRKKCHDDPLGTTPKPPCKLGANVPPQYAVWGDSHGVELAFALGEIAQRHGASLWELTGSGCPPVTDVDVLGAGHCSAHNDAVLNLLRQTRSIHTVILAGYWVERLNRESLGFTAGLKRTVDLLRQAGKRVVLIGPIPPTPFQVPRRLAHLAERGGLADARGITVSELAAKTDGLASTFAALKAEGVPEYFPASILCPQSFCRIVDGSTALYFDSNHLTIQGARLVAADAAPLIFGSSQDVSSPRIRRRHPGTAAGEGSSPSKRSSAAAV
jgi:peptidoglycan/LPS O-acetylase OafA/YrhL